MNKQTPPEPEKKATPKRRELMTLGALALGLGLITALFLLTLSKNQPAAIAADVSAVQIKAGSSLTNLPLAEGIESTEVLAQLHPIELAGESRAFMPQNAQTNSALPVTEGEVRYFRETGHTVSGLFLQHFLKTGGIEINGLPLTEAIELNGKMIQVFERTVLESIQPENGTAYVARRLLGASETQGRIFPAGANFPVNASRWFFTETQHSLAGRFLTYWQQHGGLEVFGFPISEEQAELNPQDGKAYAVQWFERARFEYHPENRGEYQVELGQLGRSFAATLQPEQLARVPEPANLPATNHDSVNVPSLMFHHIRKLGGTALTAALDRYSTDPQLFVQMLDWLQVNGYHTVTIAQIADFLNKGIALPSKPVNLRFDDGWQNQLFAAREMQKRGMTATFFIITQAHTFPYMTLDEVKSLEGMGFEVAAHTRTHPYLTRTGNAYAEIKGSKDDLEKLLGHPVRSFAYSYGSLSPYVEGLVKTAGFEIGVGVGKGYSWSRNAEYHEPAITMELITSLNQFIKRVQGTGF